MAYSYQQLNQQPGGLQASAPGYVAPQSMMQRPLVRYAPQDIGTFQLAKSTAPPLNFTFWERTKQTLFKAGQTKNIKKAMAQHPLDPGLTMQQQVMIYGKLSEALTGDAQDSLKSLLKNGRLLDTSAEDGHTTLYHLYSMLTTPRAGELENVKLVSEMVDILDKPFEITQTFARLSEKAAKQILRMRNNPATITEYQSEVARLPDELKQAPLAWSDIDVTHSANCVGSSVMYYMAQKNPSELTRHINELTSPRQAFYETVELSDVSPRYPQNAIKKLKENNIDFTFIGPQTVKVKVELPQSALVRAANASGKEPHKNTRSGVEAAYHSALTNMATKEHYDPATDYRWDDNGQLSVGITEYEKTLMESIIKDNGGVVSVTYQVATGKADPQPGEDGLPFLYGYTRTFEQTTRDIVNALKKGEPVIIGFTETLDSGLIPAGNGHEVTIVGAKVDEEGELIFRVMDTDDNIPTYVLRHAREIIPKIHHAGMPADIGLKIQDEIWTKPGYYIPDESDGEYFDPLSVTTDPLPEDSIIFFDDDYNQFMEEQQAKLQQEQMLKVMQQRQLAQQVALQQFIQQQQGQKLPQQSRLVRQPGGYMPANAAVSQRIASSQIAKGIPIQFNPQVMNQYASYRQYQNQQQALI